MVFKKLVVLDGLLRDSAVGSLFLVISYKVFIWERYEEKLLVPFHMQ